MTEEQRAKAEQYRQIASNQLCGLDQSLPERFRKPVTMAQIYEFARLLHFRPPNHKTKYGPWQAARITKIPYRVAYALCPARGYGHLFDGWPPAALFHELRDEAAALQQLDYATEMERLEQKALRNLEKALDGQITDPLVYRASKDVLERRHGKPTERVQKESLTINVHTELSAADLVAKRRLLSTTGLGRSGE